MRILILVIGMGVGILVYTTVNRSDPANAVTVAQRTDLKAIFNGNYQQWIDQFGTVSRTAFDASGRRIGTQIGTYRPGDPNGMTIEMTYVEPDAEHPLGQAFDGAGNPVPLHTGPQA
jgi:hypothetical protein